MMSTAAGHLFDSSVMRNFAASFLAQPNHHLLLAFEDKTPLVSSVASK
jgi:hypothetical protein